MNKPCIFSVFLLVCTFVLPMHGQDLRRFRVMEYNVENMFDTLRNDGRDDAEFLPQAEREWNSDRYWRKIGMIKRVVAAVGGLVPPDLVALCEVENDSVVCDLIRKTGLRRWNYKYVISRSPDRRGINSVLLYQPHSFKLLSKAAVRIPYDPNKERPTRDILHVTGCLLTGDTLDVLLCHLPSRAGGQKATEVYRERVCRLLKSRADSLVRVRERPAILMLGDFNDEYTDSSIRCCLQAEMPSPSAPLERERLYVLSAGKDAGQGITGTYKYRGNWNQLDQVIVNGRLLLPEAGFSTAWDKCWIAAYPFLLKQEADGSVRPWSTYRGTYYSGGFSDHLPLVVDFYY